MAKMKDPAFLLYPGDVYRDIAILSKEEKGQYLELMLIQHQFGSIKKDTFCKLTGKQFEDSIFSEILSENGNEDVQFLWLKQGIEARNAFNESRRSNGMKRWRK